MKQKSFVYERDLSRACPSDLPLTRIESETAPNGDKVVSKRLLTAQQILDESYTLSPVASDPSNGYVAPPNFVDKFTEIEAIRSNIDGLQVAEINNAQHNVTIEKDNNDND
jgi:hypothetical protein